MKKHFLFPLLLLSLTLEGCVVGGMPQTGEEVTDEITMSYVDNMKDDYKVGQKFVDYIDNGGLSVYQNEELFTYINPQTNKKRYNVTLSDNQSISKAFTTVGSYTVTIKFNGADDLSYAITVSDDQGGGGQDVPPVISHVESVSLDKTNITLDKDDVTKLTATVLPANADNKSVTWTSSNSTKVSVDSEGYVTAKVAGATETITVKTVDGNKTATCSVKVNDEVIPPTPVSQTITPAEAIVLADQEGSGKPTKIEYKVKGIASNVTINTYGISGKFNGSKLTFDDVKTDGFNVNAGSDVEGKEVVIKGYIELYNGTYKIGYLPASVSPTGQKYNATLQSINDSGQGGGGTTTNVDVTGVSLSPISKTLEVGQQTTLVATVKPNNATNTNVTWTSDNSNIASVSNGVVTAKAVGVTFITVTTEDGGYTATCDIEVKNSSVTPVDGDEFQVYFISQDRDDGTALTSSTFPGQVTAGANYIEFNSGSFIYAGTYGLKFGSSKNAGTLTLNTKDTIKNKNCLQLVFTVGQYGSTQSTFTFTVNGKDVGTGESSDGTITVNLDEPTQISTLSIKASKRAYLRDFKFICKEVTPVDAETVSLPSSINVSISNIKQLSVSYLPENCNRNKDITWTSLNTSIATVDQNGNVKGIAEGQTTIKVTLTHNSYVATCTVNVSRIAVTGVNIDQTSKTLAVNGSVQLTATVLPSDATNKNVSWSTSNQNVATVTSTGLVTAKAVGNATITVTTTDGNFSKTCAITVTEVQRDAWTILIYMCGADLESDNGLATGDLKEILSVGSQPSDVNIVIETGGAKSWKSTYGIRADKLTRMHVSNKTLVKDEELTYASMGASSTLQSFIEYGLTEYPAEKTGLVFWNHGGAMWGCCYDEKKNDDSLTNAEVKKAVGNAFTNTKRTDKLEFVGYDCCLMQVQDIAEFNSQYFNYMIASEESEAGYGWDYDTWVDDLYKKNSTTTILKAIVDGFIKDNGGTYSYSNDQTLSFLDLSKMAAYKSAFESYASALKSKLSSASATKSTFSNFVINNVKYYAEDDYDYFALFDAKDFINKVASNNSYNPGSSYTNAVLSAFTDLVSYSSCGAAAGNSNGLGLIYVNSSQYSFSRYSGSYYDESNSNFTNWLSLNKTYGYL